MRHYCTLSDRRYLPKLVAMIESLKRHSSEPFDVHVLCLDMETFYLLYELQLGENIVSLPLSGFERAMNLEPIRKNRTWQEYAWTCASSLMEYMLPWVGDVTYLDADLFFFSDPKPVFEEIGDLSLGITPHRFPPQHRHKLVNGRYNVGLVHAKDTSAGRSCIGKWAKNCRDWCFNRVEGHRACGDQKYLDDWESDYPGHVRSIENIGVNLAPWNVSQYQINTGPTVDGNAVVFYHFHEFQNESRLTNYPLRTQDRAFIYSPYIAAWQAVNERIAEMEERIRRAKSEMELAAQRA